MRFLFLTQYYPPEIGAAQARLSAFAVELNRAGHEVEVVTALPSYPSGSLRPEDRRVLSRREVIDGIPVRRLWTLTASGAGARRLASYLSFTATGLVGAIGVRRPDVVFVESPPLFLGVSGWLLARRFGAAFVLNVSDLWPDSVRAYGVLGDGIALRSAERLERWLYRRADAVTAVTAGIRDRLVTQKSVRAPKVLFLPNGVDPTVYRPLPDDAALRASYGLPDGPLVLYTGNHGYAHALDTLVEAACHVPEVTFALVGDGSEKERIRHLARDLGAANVRFFPPVPSAEVARLYGLALAGIATVRVSSLMNEVRPAKAFVIMGCGKPVIYSGAGEGAEIVRSASAGLVVPPEDPAAMAAAIRRLLADPAEADRLGANGRDYVESHLAWPALTAAWLAELRVALGQDPSTVDAPHHAS